MNLENALKRHLPRVWFRFKFLKYKYFGHGEPELWLLQHVVEPGTTASMSAHRQACTRTNFRASRSR